MIPIRKTGLDHLTLHPWDDIARYRGVTPLLIDLAEEPEHSHHIIKKMVDIAMDTMDQYLALGLFDPQPWSLHCTPIFTDGLQDGGFDGEHLTYRNIWGRAMCIRDRWYTGCSELSPVRERSAWASGP